MEDNLFNTQAKRDKAIFQFQDLKNHQGWQLFVHIVKANIEVLRRQLEEGLDNETLDTIKHIRDKIKIHEEMIKTPDNLIAQFTSETQLPPEQDPFD